MTGDLCSSAYNLLSTVVGANLTGNGNNVTKLNLGCESVDVEGIAFCICNSYGNVAVAVAPLGVDLCNCTLNDNEGIVGKNDCLGDRNLGVIGTFYFLVTGDLCGCACSDLLGAVVGAHLTGDGNDVANLNVGSKSVDVKGVSCIVCDGDGNIAVCGIPRSVDLYNGTADDNLSIVGESDCLGDRNLGRLGLNDINVVEENCGCARSYLVLAVVRAYRALNGNNVADFNLGRKLVNIECLADFVGNGNRHAICAVAPRSIY